MKDDAKVKEEKGREGAAPDALEKKLAETEARLKETTDQMLRMKADFDNTRKRLDRDKLDAIKFANERLLAEVLPVLDNLDRAMASISEGHDLKKVEQGLKIAQQELNKVLEVHGVETLKPVGQEFDPRFHEAVAMVETEKEKEGTVLEEVQKGYLLNGRLIRPSRVKVAREKQD